MTTNGRFGTLTIKNNGEQDVTQNCVLNVGVNVIGSSVNADVRLYDTNVDQQHCIVEVKEDGLVTVAALHIFPQTKINNLALLKNRKVILKNGDVLKISNTEITYNNNIPSTCNQAGITKQIKQKIFPFNTPRRRSCNLTSSSAKKAPLASGRLGAINKPSLFSPSPLIVKKNLPPKHNDDWPSEPLDRDQFPFVGHFSPQKKERPLQDIPEATSGLEDILKPSSPSLVNVVAPTVRTSTCTSTSDFDKKKNDETMVPDVKSEISINSNDVSLNSFYKPSVCVSACLSGRKSSLPAQNTNPKTSKRQNRSSSCVTPTKASLPIKSRLTCSEHKLSNESQPSFLQSESIDMENSTILLRHENSELNSSTPTAVRTSNNLTLLGTPTSIIKKRDSMLSLNKTDKTNIMDNSEACEKSKSRLFDPSLESVDGDSLAVSTDTSSFVYESALAVLPSVDDFEVEEIVEDFQENIAPANKSLDSSTIAPNDSDISGIASLASTPEPKNTISNYEMVISHVDIGESTSNQTDLSYESTVSVHNDEDTLKDSQFEQVQNYSSITISSNENLDTSDAGSLSSDLIDLREPSFEDEMEEIRRNSKRRMSLDIESQPEACNSMHRLSQILNIDEQKQETSKSNNTSQIQNTEEEVIPVNAEFQSSTAQIGIRSSARKSKMYQVTDEETNSSSMPAIEYESGNGSSLILTMDQEDGTTDESSIIEKKVNETFTLSETPAKMAGKSETLQTIVVQNEEIDNSEIEDNDEKIEIVPERKSKRISLRQGTPVVSGNSSTRKSKSYQLPKIHVNDQTIEINDSEDTDASTASESKSKRKSTLLRTPAKNSPASSEVRSTRKSKISQTIELNDSEDTDDASTRNKKLFQTPVKNSPAVSVVRSTRKSSIQTSSLQEGSDCSSSVQISEDLDALVEIQNPLIQSFFGFDDSDDTDSSVSTENTASIERSPVAANVTSVRTSKIVQTPLLQDDNAVENQDVLVATDRKSKRISKVLQTSLIPDTPLTAGTSKDLQTFVLQNEEGSDYSDLEDISGRSLTGEVRSTRKSQIVQTPSLLVDEIVESEDISASGRKSKRISNVHQTSLIPDTPLTAGTSKDLQTFVLQNEEGSDYSDLEDISGRSLTGEVRSTRKSQIVQTPSLQVYEMVEPEDISASGRKSKRISNILKSPSVSGTPITSGVVSARKSKIFQTSLLEDEEASKSGDVEEVDDSILTKNKSRRTLLQTPSMPPSPTVAEVRSTRKSKIVQTPTLPDDKIVEPEDTLAATDRRSKRISKVLKTSSILDSPDISEVDSTTKSQVSETSDFSDSVDEDDSVSTSTDLQASSIQGTSPAAVEVRSTRKSKIVQTPSLQVDEIIESEGISTSGRKTRRISNVIKTPLILGTPITSGVGSTRKSKVLQTPPLENIEASQSRDLEDVDGSTSTLLQTPSMQSSLTVAEVRSTRKSKIVESQDASAGTERKSKRISKALQTSEVESQVFETSDLQDEAHDSSGSEDMDDSVFTDNDSITESALPQAQPVQCTPTSLQGEVVESENISASGRKSRKISNILKTPSVSGTPITSGVVSARKSKIFQTSLSEDEEMDDSILTKDKSRHTSTLLQTPSMQPSPTVAQVRSTRKSKIVSTPSLQDDIEGNTDEEADQLKDTSPTAANKSRTSKLPSTPLVQSSPASSGVRSTRKSKILNTPLLQNEESLPVLGDDARVSTNAVALDVLDATENDSSTFQDFVDSGVTAIETDRKSKRISKIPSLQNTPTASGVIPTRKSKILQTPLSEKEPAETETTTLLQTPSTHDLPSTSGIRSTRKSKVSKTPLLLNNQVDVETEEVDTPVVNKSKLLSTPLSSPVVLGVRSTRKSKISVTPIVVSAMQTRRGSKAPQTPMIQEEANTSKRTSKLIQTNLDNTPGTSGIQVKRTSQVLKTPSMQDFNQTNSPRASGNKSKRISKLQQTPSIQEEANLSNESGRKSGTPKNMGKSKTPVSSAIKPQRISKAFETPSLIDFEEIESPLASPVKSRNTSKVLTFNTPTDKDDSESEVETSPAPKRRKIGGRTAANAEPCNDLTDVQGVKILFKTPKVQKQPRNDLTDVRGVKTMLKTPKAVKEPKNDLTNVKGVKKLMATPKVQNSPANDLTNVGGVKKLLKTPRAPKEPRNDLTDIQGVKKLMATPTKQKSPRNDLSDVRGVKQLVVTPKPRKSANLSGLGDFFATTSKTTTPKHGLSEAGNVKKILDIKKSKKSLKVQNSPKNDLINVVGVKKMFAEEEAEYNREFNVSGVAEIMNKSDELFNSLLDKKPPKTYGRKSTPLKLDASVTIGVVSETPVMSEEVVNWVNTQDFNKGEVVDNLTPIKSKNSENLSISKKQDVAIHSSTPLNKDNRGILKEIEANIHKDMELSEAMKDKNLKKVQFLDDSNLRKSKRTPRTPSKITTEFVMTSPKSRKRKADEDENLNLAKVPKMVSESNNASVIIIDSETDQEDAAVTRKVLPEKGAKKALRGRPKKTTRVNSNSDKVEEESVDNNQEDEKVEAPKTTRGRAIRKTNKKDVEVENDEEINASIEKIEAPKTTRGRPGKKTNAKMTKKMKNLQIENTEEIKTRQKVEENEEIEAPKSTWSRNLKKTSINENSIEETETPKTKRGRPLQKTNTKTSIQMEKDDDEEKVEADEEVEPPKTTRGRQVKKTNTKATKKVEKVENSTNDDEEIEIPKTKRGRATKKTSATNLKASLTEEKNESLRKTTRSRKVEKKPEPEKQVNSSVEILSDEEKDEPVIEVPKKTRGRPASKTNEEVLENNVDDEIEVPKTTRGRPVKKTSARTSKKSLEENLKASLTEEKNESLRKTTRSRKVTKKPEPEKQLDSSVEILSDDEKDESAIEVKKTTRGRAASKTNKKVPEEKNESLRKTTRSRKVTKKPEPEKQLDSSVEILSDDEKDESAIEVKKTTRGRAASKTNKKVPEKSTRLRAAAPRGKKAAEVETSINSTLESSKAKIVETSVTLSKTKRTRGMKRSLEVESTEEQENSIIANQKKNSKRLKGGNDSQLEKELEVSKTSRRRPVVTKTTRANKNSIENSEMEESKNESVRGRKTKAAVQSESKSEEESKGAKTRGKRKLYSLDDSVKIDVEEVVKVEVKKVMRTRNVKEKAEVVAPVRSSKRTRK